MDHGTAFKRGKFIENLSFIDKNPIEYSHALTRIILHKPLVKEGIMQLLSFLDEAVDVGSNIAKAMSNTSLWTAIAKTIIIIFLGFILTKKKIFPQGTGKVLTKVVMTVALPCLAFSGFMTDYSLSAGVDAIVNLVFGFIIYIIFIFLSKLIFIWVKDPTKRTVLCVLFAFGSTTFFAQPLINAIFPAAFNNSNMLNVAYRVFLYSYAYLAISGFKLGENEETSVGKTLKKIFLNPVILATLVGLVLWFLQAIPGVNFVHKDWLTTNTSEELYAIWRFDITLPWIHPVVKTLGGLSSPLVWLAIGCTLGNASIKEAATDKYAWIFSAIKVFSAPLIVLGILALVEWIATLCGYPQLISAETMQSSLMMWMVPPATVAVAYCINFDKEKQMASNASVISTLLAVPGIVVWVLIITLLTASGFFPSVAA